MKVIKLVAENIKGLKAIEITPDEHFQVISGKNGQGKSSVLDAIWFAIGGKDALKNTDKPVREGQEQASVSLDLGDLIVTRKWKNDKTSLDVRTKDGAKYSSPQSVLDSLIGRLSFDPLAFSNLKEDEQKKSLLGLVELSVNPEELDKQKKEIFDQRTTVNREVKQLEGQLAGMKVPDKDIPDEEVVASEIMQKIQEANEQKVANNDKRMELKNISHQYQSIKSDVEDIESKIAELNLILENRKSVLNNLSVQGKSLKADVDQLVDPDFDTLKQQLSEVEETNRKVRAAKEYKSISQKLANTKQKSEALTYQIDGINKQKEDALKQAKFPIDGLGFDETGVTFNKIPFKQCSASERLKVSMAMAMAMNPKLRVIRILDGSLLDSENMKLIQEMAKDNDFQVWIEQVDSSGKIGIYIEEGEVRNHG